MGDAEQGTNVDFKVVLLGMHSIGKTCLFQRFLHNRYSDLSNTPVCHKPARTTGARSDAKHATQRQTDHRRFIRREASRRGRPKREDQPVGHGRLREIRVDGKALLPRRGRRAGLLWFADNTAAAPVHEPHT